MISEGYTGRKGKGGFYRMNKDGKQKILEGINLKTGSYTTSQKIDLGIGDKVDFKKLLSRKDKYGNYARLVIFKIINY